MFRFSTVGVSKPSAFIASRCPLRASRKLLITALRVGPVETITPISSGVYAHQFGEVLSRITLTIILLAIPSFANRG